METDHSWGPAPKLCHWESPVTSLRVEVGVVSPLEGPWGGDAWHAVGAGSSPTCRLWAGASLLQTLRSPLGAGVGACPDFSPLCLRR